MRGDVRLAYALGVAPSTLWGSTPETVTEYEYDDDGRLVRSVSRTESEFSELDRGLLLAWDEIKLLTGRHGQLLTEALSNEADPNNPDGTYTYVAGELVNGQRVPLTDFAERALKLQQDRYYKAYGEDDRAYHHWNVQRVPRAAKRKK